MSIFSGSKAGTLEAWAVNWENKAVFVGKGERRSTSPVIRWPTFCVRHTCAHFEGFFDLSFCFFHSYVHLKSASTLYAHGAL